MLTEAIHLSAKMKLYFIKKRILGEIVDQYNSSTISIKSFDDGPESLLTGCIPNLQLDFIVINLDSLSLELSSKGDMMFLDKTAFDISSQETTFANSRITYNDDLELNITIVFLLPS